MSSQRENRSLRKLALDRRRAEYGVAVRRTLQVIDKERSALVGIDPLGHYGVLLRFDDGHDTGIYAWTLLYELGKHQDACWQRHLDERIAAGRPRAIDAP